MDKNYTLDPLLQVLKDRFSNEIDKMLEKEKPNLNVKETKEFYKKAYEMCVPTFKQTVKTMCQERLDYKMQTVSAIKQSLTHEQLLSFAERYSDYVAAVADSKDNQKPVTFDVFLISLQTKGVIPPSKIVAIEKNKPIQKVTPIEPAEVPKTNEDDFFAPDKKTESKERQVTQGLMPENMNETENDELNLDEVLPSSDIFDEPTNTNDDNSEGDF